MLGFIDLSVLTNFINVLWPSKCGFIDMDNDVRTLTALTSGAVTVIQIFVPVALIIMGMVDMGKAVMQQKEDDIKKAQQVFITRLVAAAITFLIITVVKLVFNVITANQSGANNIWACVQAFINNN